MHDEPGVQVPATRKAVKYIPVTLEYVKYQVGTTPEEVSELRHLTFTNYSYAGMLKELGVDDADTKSKASIEKATKTLKSDSIRKGCTMIWAAMLTEDPLLTVDDVMKMVDIAQFQELTLEVVRAMAYYVNGPLAHVEADEAVDSARESIEEAQAELEKAASDTEEDPEKKS
ncbi:MAG: hypothetical protein GY938_12965 [Ketobacter sp.]|nr:hypothetical protein [Ketobacter sp.]